MQMIQIFSSDSPLHPTLREAVLSYGPTVFALVVVLALLGYGAQAVWNRFVTKKLESRAANLRAHGRGAGPAR
ncbi:hypothetical protein [Kocuria tytonis]|uniref:Uncharacterized protein n=1 Tax=Kocuria tytonis TaxID=2054280 RepID=A0A495A7J1_9MICC|nr:hypothetical protein [Kocuria tytonis]RKQ35322.1 hypothetical protein C1C97_008850 [Kocuria tytonis]